MTNLDSILKSRDITLSTKVRLVKAMVFPVVRYGCESWTVKEAKSWKIDALNYGFGEDSWESLGLQGDPTSPSFARRSNQSILKEISRECSLEGLMLKVKLQYFGHLMWRVDSLEKTLMLGGEGADRGWDGWMASLAQWTWIWAHSRRWWRTGKLDVLQSMGLQGIGHELATEQQQCIFMIFPKKV